MKKTRRLFALLMTLAMVLTYMPTAAFADTEVSADAYPTSIEYDGPDLMYDSWDENKCVDPYQEGAKFIVKYSDDSEKIWICRKYDYKQEGRKYTANEYFLDGADPEFYTDDEGNQYVTNALYFDYTETDTDVTVTYEEEVGEQLYTVTTTLPKSEDKDSKYKAFIALAKNWYDHAMFDESDEYSFYVPCEAAAEAFEMDFTKEDMDKVSITVTTSDGKTYSPVVTRDPEFSDGYLYTYKIPQQKWGSSFTINFDYNNGKVTDKLDCVVKRWVDLKYTVKDLTYTGKELKPSITVKDGKTTLTPGKDYEIGFDDPEKVVKNVGTYGVYLNALEDSKYAIYADFTFKVVPKGTTVGKLTKGKKSFTVSWKKQTTQTTGYQIQYSLKKNFKGAKTVTISKNSTTKTTVKKLKAKKTYYVRVRTYKTVKGKKICSAWSAAKTVKTK